MERLGRGVGIRLPEWCRCDRVRCDRGLPSGGCHPGAVSRTRGWVERAGLCCPIGRDWSGKARGWNVREGCRRWRAGAGMTGVGPEMGGMAGEVFMLRGLCRAGEVPFRV